MANCEEYAKRIAEVIGDVLTDETKSEEDIMGFFQSAVCYLANAHINTAINGREKMAEIFKNHLIKFNN